MYEMKQTTRTRINVQSSASAEQLTTLHQLLYFTVEEELD